MSYEYPAAPASRAASSASPPFPSGALSVGLLAEAERSLLAGNLVMAAWLCEEVRRVDPDSPGALHLLGLIAEREGRLCDASRLFRQALAAEPEFGAAWLSLASLHRSSGNAKAALLCCRSALLIDPADRDGWYNLGNVLLDDGCAFAAAEAYGRALGIDRHHDPAWHNLGIALHLAGRSDAALTALGNAAAYRPDNPAPLHQIAVVRFRTGDLDGALRAVGRQARLDPAQLDSSLIRLLAIALRDAGRTGDAIPITALAVAHRPEDVDLRHCLGMLHLAVRDMPAADAIFRATLCHGPADPFALNSYGVMLSGMGRSREGVRLLRRSLLLQPGNAEIHSNLLLTLQYDGTLGLADLYRLHAEWYRRHAPSGGPAGARRVAPDAIRDPGRRLRIGYVSADFGQHPVGFFLSGVVLHHDRDSFEVHCYSARRRSDALTDRFRRMAEHWHEIGDTDGEELADRIRGDGIDILVDLSGHTANNRLRAFVHRPAPVQATWAGYVGTTGIPAIDYLISDPRQTPDGVDPHYAERIMRLPDCYVCYEPPPYAPPVGPLPALESGVVTFGCFNNLAKLDESSIALWSTLLRDRPDRRLMLQTFALDVPSVRDAVAARFAAHGVAPGQLDLRRASGHAGLLQSYNSVDIALDPLAYSGGLTTLEALWMGVPVITLPGERFCTRHSLSHLTAAGLPGLVAEDASGYLARAEGLAADLGRLADLRGRLRDRMAASPLCDAAHFTRTLEAAFRRMWRDRCLTGRID
ncbi:tetratricopeptide repeat protein [Skermanella sp. TT6]|uniref:protein O-GlcNAc transferase n=1 Tax=Skermanella cutis TaxID=2775420 RepID=A0ABX7B3G9_9PROT|nr:glycosyltransferase family 41 protein [Skermanella sp. TT6]QQP88852.1 tetratricopeptide repeat protein [Skermanella sp. TT6]